MWDSIDFSHGGHGILISIAVLLFLNMFGFMAKFIFDSLRRKSHLSEKSMSELNKSLQDATFAMKSLSDRISTLEKDFKDVERLKSDTRRMLLIIKHMAKDDWAEIKRVFFDDEI